MQGRFLPQCHSNRPDSFEDTLKNSFSRSTPLIDSLLNYNAAQPRYIRPSEGSCNQCPVHAPLFVKHLTADDSGRM